MNDPDLLLLDEPTNHLDVGTILRVEDFSLRYEKTLMFVTHDRAFLERLATRIVEMDRGRLISFACSYRTYIERRQAMLDAEEKQWHEFDKKLSKEEAWIRQGIKARRTRDEGRVRALIKMREERKLRQEQAGVSRLLIREAERGGRMVVDARRSRSHGGMKRSLTGFPPPLFAVIRSASSDRTAPARPPSSGYSWATSPLNREPFDWGPISASHILTNSAHSSTKTRPSWRMSAAATTRSSLGARRGT